MEALLRTKVLDAGACEKAESIAQRLYANLTSRELRFSEFVELDGKRKSVLSRDALAALRTLISDHYKRDYQRSASTANGIERLWAAETAAETHSVKSKAELISLLDAHSDHVIAFVGNGQRVFPDGTLQVTDHAFLLYRSDEGKILVHDPNYPTVAVECHVGDTGDTEAGVTVEWTCPYRDTGVVTTKYYVPISLVEYFTHGFGSDN